ncbi:hypothetical protein [Citricoccus alkalitolerans]|uniref:Uncharacterized protein n=1 Tax=Citricoccus alkalitolerans TaxID=246603 RepID=A0ABV8Y2K9_9MICC
MEMQTMVVGLMVDPGLSRQVARSAAGDLKQDLSDHGDDGHRWEVEVGEENLPLTAEGDIPLMDQAGELRSRYGWDFVLYLTDLPRYHDEDPLLCEVSATHRAALVSLTAMGAFRLKAKIRKLLIAVIHSAREGADDYPLVKTVQTILGFKGARRVSRQGRGDAAYIVLPGWLSRLNLLSGMVRSNKPGRMLPALSGAITAATASGAFGVYYSSIWALADAAHPARLVMIAVIVILALTGWLIFRNGLWNKRKEIVSPWQGGMDNVTTVIMVATSVALMYLVLTAVLFGLSLAVISPGYLHSELMHPVSLLDYAELSWLAASLGTLFGALGSNFDSNEKIRAATYSKRQHERMQKADAYND